ncbi:MAG: hypothetical protein M1831_005363 [Alyxoria varia]|nr:MAG: hypothetical protein M1831_005363 [Alyxoria varia]
MENPGRPGGGLQYDEDVKLMEDTRKRRTQNHKLASSQQQNWPFYVEEVTDNFDEGYEGDVDIHYPDHLSEPSSDAEIPSNFTVTPAEDTKDPLTEKMQQLRFDDSSPAKPQQRSFTSRPRKRTFSDSFDTPTDIPDTTTEDSTPERYFLKQRKTTRKSSSETMYEVVSSEDTRSSSFDAQNSERPPYPHEQQRGDDMAEDGEPMILE